MIVYLDTSAWVKLYVEEPDRETVLQIVRSASSLMISELGLVEAYSALWRKASYEGIPLIKLGRILRELENDWISLGHIRLVHAVVVEAKKLIKQFLLRSYDAVHLASALVIAHSLKEPLGFLCFDAELNKVAKRCRGLKVF